MQLVRRINCVGAILAAPTWRHPRQTYVICARAVFYARAVLTAWKSRKRGERNVSVRLHFPVFLTDFSLFSLQFLAARLYYDATKFCGKYPYLNSNFHVVIHLPQYLELTVMGVMPALITSAILDCCRKQRNATHTSRTAPGAA